MDQYHGLRFRSGSTEKDGHGSGSGDGIMQWGKLEGAREVSAGVFLNTPECHNNLSVHY